jgi:hypothetical protein
MHINPLFGSEINVDGGAADPPLLEAVAAARVIRDRPAVKAHHDAEATAETRKTLG